MSQVKIRLPDDYFNCPPAYLNMLMHLRTDADEGWIYSGNVRDIRHELKKSNARYCEKSDTIVFPSEADYAGWLLKWL